MGFYYIFITFCTMIAVNREKNNEVYNCGYEARHATNKPNGGGNKRNKQKLAKQNDQKFHSLYGL